MVNSSTTTLNYASQIVPWMLQAIDDAKKQDATVIWNATVPVLYKHFGFIFLVLAGILLMVAIEALATRRWRMLGQVLYSYIHLGFLFLCGLIFGPTIYVKDYFDLINFFVYLGTFYVVGKIVETMGLKRRYP